MPNPLLKIYSRPSPWCLRLNKLCLKPTNHIFLKPLDLPVFGVKLPFTFSLSSKSQSLLTTIFFASSLKLFPPFLQSGWTFLHTLSSFHLFFSSSALFLMHRGCVDLLTPHSNASPTHHWGNPPKALLPPLKHWEMSYWIQSSKPGIWDSLSPGPNLPFNPYILLLCNTSLKPSSTDILTVLQFHLVLPVSILWQNLSCLSFSPNKYHVLRKLSQPGS